MAEKGKITAGQLAFLIYSLLAYDGLLLIPKVTGEAAGRDLWLSPVWAHLAGLFFLLAMFRLGRMFPEETIIEYSQRLLGKYLGKAAGLVVVFYLAYLTSVILRIYGDFISSVFLEITPPLVSAGGIMVLISYTVRAGVETLGRLAQLFLPITVLVFALLVVLTIPEWDVSNVFPILGNGLAPSLKGAVVPFSWFGAYIVLGLYLPLLSNRRKAALYGLAAWFLLMVTLVVSGLVAVFLFGQHAISLNYPFVEVVRYIAVGEFFQHIDALLLAVWLPGTFIQLAIYQYGATLGMAQWIGLKDYRALALPLGFLILVMSFWTPPSNIDFERYMAGSHIFLDFTFFVFGLLLFLTAWIRSKFGAQKAK
ncbi:MAG: endospore germination permease [Paenibacillus macerans]|uniref:Endospore germination permease n=2 Tax=Paenibacillus macerans TaxID=44252 RepID=A0A090Z5F8_PAEMA|nr:endospore germination permease [Paenibacillus macerans]KFN05897.1 spore germination family protein [Paenibacillus macerans]MDU7472314.1 endospore germination permease [Paenibacillus macerans]MEC0329324.1 endospore germination permease [Paenibacillus macerans]MUG24932.1 endospore germination permease [Paenibacillus macerans]UMV49849.1 endospore germination permease [Paenibacillus macerans]